ncbi:putative molybdenum carrier protein [Catalinimonas sp. 4WD22]|uniref:putative molybdenum carrier protein n=1 Tax=Catalinimonas locisalis TaxID=3133978 RepID=UPI0031017299
MLVKIISGGQTGVDQAALRVAQDLGLQHGGWCPPGHICEDGRIPESFTLMETPQERSEHAPNVPRSQRTEWNVRDADATLILTFHTQPEDASTLWTLKAAEMYDKPLMMLDPRHKLSEAQLVNWLDLHQIRILNVAGPAESREKGIGEVVFAFLRGAVLNNHRKY